MTDRSVGFQNEHQYLGHTTFVRSKDAFQVPILPEILTAQITEWFASEDVTGKKMQHRVQGVTGKDLIRALHEAPEDMAAWLDPAASGDGKTIQEGMKDERFKSLREGLVRTLAERSVSFYPRLEGKHHQIRDYCGGSSPVRRQHRCKFKRGFGKAVFVGLVRIIAGVVDRPSFSAMKMTSPMFAHEQDVAACLFAVVFYLLSPSFLVMCRGTCSAYLKYI